MVEIQRNVLDGIATRLIADYPNEGCGFLLGTRGEDGSVRVTAHRPVDNHRLADGEGHHRYLIGPDDFRWGEREARAAGLVVQGTYHSHPDVPAVPSAYDRDHAWPWYIYLIVSVVNGRVDAERLWELQPDREAFLEQEWKVASSS